MQYTYDFNYSLHLEHMPQRQSQLLSQDKDFSLASKALTEADCLKIPDTRQFVGLLLRQPIFSKMGNMLQRLSQLELGLIPKNLENIQQLQTLRQQLCECIKEMNVMLGREREYYLNVIILCMTLIIGRSLKQKHQADIKQEVLFHLLHWELKGQHSTSSFIQRLYGDLLVEEKVTAYIRGIQLKAQLHPLENSLSFKQLQSSFQSMKMRSSTSGFAVTLNKQNQNLHNKLPSGMISLRTRGIQGSKLNQNK